LNNPNSSNTEDDPDPLEVTLREYFNILMRYRITFVMVVVVILVTSISMNTFMPKKYTAISRILSINPNANANTVERMLGRSHTTVIDPNTISRIARSPRALKEALRYTLEDFNSLEDIKISPEEAFLANNLSEGSILSSISILEDKDTYDVINISATLNESPNLCASIANAVSRVILEALTENNRKVYKLEVTNLEKLIKNNEIEIESLDQRIKEIISGDTGFKLSIDEYGLTNRLGALENQLSETELKIKEIEDQVIMIKIDFGIENIPFDKVRWIDLSSPMFRKLQELKFQREELLTRYFPENPSVKKIDHQIESLEDTLKPTLKDKDIVYVEVDRFKTAMATRLQQLITEVSALKKRTKHIKGELESTQDEILSTPEEQKKVIDLRKKKEILEKLQINLHTNLQTTKMNLLGTYSNFEILEHATPAKSSSSMSLARYIVMGLAFGMAISTCIVIILKFFENTIKSTSDLKRHFKYPSLGGIPNWKVNNMYIDEMEPDSRISEVYGVLRNHIRFSSHNRPEKCLLVSSALQGEGKTLTTTNLALSFALEGNQVLLISADLRRPESLTNLLQKPEENGIVEYLEGRVDLKDVIYSSISRNLSVIPTIYRSNNPTRLINSPRFKELIDYGENNYDVLIIDSPAVLPVVDTTMFANLVRGVVVLVQADSATIGSSNELINRLEHVEAPIIGICLNNINDVRLEYRYSYSYSSNPNDSPYK